MMLLSFHIAFKIIANILWIIKYIAQPYCGLLLPDFMRRKGYQQSFFFFLALSCTWFSAAGLHVWRQREHNGCFSLTACGSFLTACDSETAAVKSRLANYYECCSLPPIQPSILPAKTIPILN